MSPSRAAASPETRAPPGALKQAPLLRRRALCLATRPAAGLNVDPTIPELDFERAGGAGGLRFGDDRLSRPHNRIAAFQCFLVAQCLAHTVKGLEPVGEARQAGRHRRLEALVETGEIGCLPGDPVADRFGSEARGEGS